MEENFKSVKCTIRIDLTVATRNFQCKRNNLAPNQVICLNLWSCGKNEESLSEQLSENIYRKDTANNYITASRKGLENEMED